MNYEYLIKERDRIVIAIRAQVDLLDRLIVAAGGEREAVLKPAPVTAIPEPTAPATPQAPPSPKPAPPVARSAPVTSESGPTPKKPVIASMMAWIAKRKSEFTVGALQEAHGELPGYNAKIAPNLLQRLRRNKQIESCGLGLWRKLPPVAGASPGTAADRYNKFKETMEAEQAEKAEKADLAKEG